MKRLLTMICALALGVAVATDHTYSVSDATELAAALATGISIYIKEDEYAAERGMGGAENGRAEVRRGY